MKPNIENLKCSWTKYDLVTIIGITIENDLNTYISLEKPITESVLKNYLGVENLTDEIPSFWKNIYNHPDQVGLFALIAALFTHYENIDKFANSFADGNMGGTLIMEEGKHFTNLRSALVQSGASESVFRRKREVPYDFSKLYQSGEVGKLAKELFINRFRKIGFTDENIETDFVDIAELLQFPKALSLTINQFKDWTNGIAVSNSLIELEKNGITYEKYGKIKALKVHQWLNNWDQVSRYGEKNRLKPEAFFYQFNIPALLLKRIYDIHARRAFVGRNEEQYSQRKHNKDRSNEIREFVNGGFPWSTIKEQQRNSEGYKNLQMPGWLPTSIIANILTESSKRKEREIENDAVITINNIDDNFAEIILPKKIWSDTWAPLVSPVEIIDGQHRIRAFDGISQLEGRYEFPVIAFHNLDFTWQAYLFYTINIKPKRINTSLAYDLMPLLRIQDWLEQDLSGPDIYKKVRAQELTELLYSAPISPWYDRINMLGDSGEAKGGPVSQNAFINSLTTSFVKKWDGKIGGLFGGELHEGEQDVIQWDKETQAAFLVMIWRSINSAIGKSKVEWVVDLKNRPLQDGFKNRDLQIPFVHPMSFFTTDQGIRPILFIFNDMFFEANDQLKLHKFFTEVDYEKYTTDEIIELIFLEFRSQRVIAEFASSMANEIVNNFDWRTPSAFNPDDNIQDQKRQNQNQFRGSGGYREMRMQLMKILAASEIKIEKDDGLLEISVVAKQVQSKLS